MEKLLSCPFCGSTDIVMNRNSYGKVDDCFVLCRNPNCCAEGPVRTTEGAAIKAWNTRTLPENTQCFKCGYKGPDYLNPDKHTCARRYSTGEEE